MLEDPYHPQSVRLDPNHTFARRPDVDSPSLDLVVPQETEIEASNRAVRSVRDYRHDDILCAARQMEDVGGRW